MKWLLLLSGVAAQQTVPPTEVCVSLTLFDAYGNGWDGAVFSVSDGVDIKAEGTLETGYGKTQDICLPFGCYTFSVTEGTFPSEVSWSLGGGILKGGAPDSGDFLVSPDGSITASSCSKAPTLTPVPSPPRQCLTMFLQDAYGDGWQGARYKFIKDDSTEVRDGTLESGFQQVDDVCLAYGSCYTLKVSDGLYPYEVYWYLTDGALVVSGGALAVVDFYVDEAGFLVQGSCTASPTATPAPSQYSIRQMKQTASCYELGCKVEATFDTSEIAGFVTSAFLTIELDGDFRGPTEYAEIGVMDVLKTCGDLECGRSLCPTFSSRDVTSEAQKGSVTVTYMTSPQVHPICPPDDHAMHAEATLDLILSETILPTPKPTSTKAPTRTKAPAADLACFPIIMEDFWGDGWDLAAYTIRSNGPEGPVVAQGSLTDGFNQTDTVCVPQEIGCYTLQVGAGDYPSEIFWILGDFDVRGGAPTEVDFFVYENGVIGRGSCSSAPTSSPAPTMYSPRTLTKTATCYADACAVNASFDTSLYANDIVNAELTIDLEGDFGSLGAYSEIHINNADAGYCPEAWPLFDDCVPKRCGAFNSLNVTDAARSGAVLLAFATTYNVRPRCGFNSHAMLAEATLVLDLKDRGFLPPPPPPSSTTSSSSSSSGGGGGSGGDSGAGVLVAIILVCLIVVGLVGFFLYRKARSYRRDDGSPIPVRGYEYEIPEWHANNPLGDEAHLEKPRKAEIL